jgi:hypothetical protein
LGSFTEKVIRAMTPDNVVFLTLQPEEHDILELFLEKNIIPKKSKQSK